MLIPNDIKPEILSLAQYLNNKELVKHMDALIARTMLSSVDDCLFWSHEESLIEHELPVTPKIQKTAAEIITKQLNKGITFHGLDLNTVTKQFLFHYLEHRKKEEKDLLYFAYSWCVNAARHKVKLQKKIIELGIQKKSK